MLDFLTNQAAVKLMDQVGQPFKSVPHLPKEITNFLVTIIPWLALIGGVTGIIGAITTITGGSAVYRMSALVGVGSSYSTYMIVASVFSLITAALLLMAFTPLKNKAAAGWAFLFWTNVVSIAQNVVSLIIWQGGILGIIVGVIIGLYLLYEVRPLYK